MSVYLRRRRCRRVTERKSPAVAGSWLADAVAGPIPASSATTRQ